jgi:adenylosuccinate synthase
MDKLAAAGVSLERLLISERAQVVMPYHQTLDGLDEARRSGQGAEIGTTKKGIGPCYTDKAARIGLQVGDLLDQSWLKGRVAELVSFKNEVIEKVYGGDPLDADEVFDALCAAGDRLRPHIGDILPVLEDAVAAGHKILLEGQLGALRDIDWGTYPYVTSSSPTAGGASAGAGIPPALITQVVGVAKAYTTAVGAGPSPPSWTATKPATCASWAASTAPPRAGRGAAAGSMPWPCDTRRASTGSPSWPSPSSTCSTRSKRSRSARPIASRAR